MAKKRKNKKQVGYFDFDTPTQETAIQAGKVALLIGAGLMVAKAGMAVVPTNYSKYAKAGVAAIGIGIAASAKNETVKLIGSGVAALQVTGFVSELAKKNLHLKGDTTMNKILKAGLGMNGSANDGLAAADYNYATVSDWQPQYETIDLEEVTPSYPSDDIVYG